MWCCTLLSYIVIFGLLRNFYIQASQNSGKAESDKWIEKLNMSIPDKPKKITRMK